MSKAKELIEMICEGIEDKNFATLQNIIKRHPKFKRLEVIRRDPGAAKIVTGTSALAQEVALMLEDDHEIYETDVHRNHLIVHLYW